MDCPTDDVLISFAAGMLEPNMHESVQTHVKDCSECTQKVQWFVDELLQGAYDDLQAKSEGTTSWTTGDSDNGAADPTAFADLNDSFDASLIQPSKIPGALGQLDKYQIHGIIGDGAMGIVLKALDESLGRTVAIKALKRQLCSNARARRRFIREARSVAAISHPNVVTVFEVNEQQFCPYMVMEYVAGGTLRQYIREKGRLPADEVVRLSKGIAEGLAAAHQQGVIHRDIKPANLLLERSAVRVKISDFGLARAAVGDVDLTSHGLAVGTPSYMSPEQVQGKKLDCRSDLFSLGCVIYAMITGQSPFRGDCQFDIARRILEHDPAPLDQIVPETPPFLVELTQRLLAKNADDRFASAEEVAEHLEGFLARLNESTTDEFSNIMRQVRLTDKHGDVELSQATTTMLRKRGAWRYRLIVLPLMLVLAALMIWQPWRWLTDGPPDLQQILVGDPAMRPGAVATIGQAIGLAQPGSLILIHPDKEYWETLVLSDPQRLANVTLAAAPDAVRPPVLNSPAPSSTLSVITIHNVAGVTIRGLEIRPSGSYGIVLEGSCPDVVIEGVHCIQPIGIAQPGIDIRAYAAPEDGGPIIIRDSTFYAPGAGHCLRLTQPDGLHAVRVQGNRFWGRGVLVLAEGILSDVVICRNFFVKADVAETDEHWVPSISVGLNVNIPDPLPDDGFVVCNNTFFQLDHWLGLVESVTDQQANIALVNNLIVACGIVQGEPHLVEQAATNWRFQANYWEPTPELSSPDHDPLMLAKMHPPIKLVNRNDPRRADFLRPIAGSPLWTAGVGDQAFPEHVGAHSPDNGSSSGFSP